MNDTFYLARGPIMQSDAMLNAHMHHYLSSSDDDDDGSLPQMPLHAFLFQRERQQRFHDRGHDPEPRRPPRLIPGLPSPPIRPGEGRGEGR